MCLIHLVFALTFNKVMAVDDYKRSAKFEVIQNPTNEQTNMFHKSFHECSRNGPCNFVAKNITTRKYYTYNKVDDIPPDRKMLTIWKRKSTFNILVHFFWKNFQDLCYVILITLEIFRRMTSYLLKIGQFH